MKRLISLLIVLIMLLSFTVANAYEFETTLDAAHVNETKINLTNLDLDGTLQPGMYEGKTIRVATTTGDYVDSMNEFAEVFKDLTGGTVEIISIADDFYPKVELGLAQGHTYDIVIMPPAYIHSFAAAGYIADLSPLIEQYAAPDFDQPDFIPGLWNVYSEYNNQKVAFPYKADVEFFFYRKDLFEDPAVQQQYRDWSNGEELAVPKTIDEMVKVASFFTKSINPDSPIEYGFCSQMGDCTRFSWFNILCSMGGKEVNEDYSLGFKDGTGVKALDVMCELAKCAPADWLTFDWDLANSFYAQGNAAMMWQWPGLASVCNQEGSPTAGKVGYDIIPGSYPILGGWALGIASDSAELEMAFKFCEMVTSKDGEIMKIKYTFDPCRTSNYSREGVEDLYEFYPVLLESLAHAKQLANTDVPYVATEVADVEERYLHDAIAGDITTEEAVDLMVTEIEQIINDMLEDQ